MSPPELSRPELISAAAIVAALPRQLTAGDAAPPATTGTTLRVNGETHRLDVDDRATLLDTLREALALAGTKKGCDRGERGACTYISTDDVRCRA